VTRTGSREKQTQEGGSAPRDDKTARTTKSADTWGLGVECWGEKYGKYTVRLVSCAA
jgi:hypothetical protein